MGKITILITEDHTLVREAWTLLLNKDPRFKVIAKTGSGEEAAELVSQLHPDIVLMDINLPGINGFEAIQLIKKTSPATKILGVSMYTQPSLVRKMIRKGAKGYVTKGSSSEEMCKAIVEVHHNRVYICDAIKNSITKRVINEYDQQSAFESLSKREIEVIEFVKNGFSSKEIAESLRICLKTVEAHRYNILKKLNLKNVAALVNYINSTGLSFSL